MTFARIHPTVPADCLDIHDFLELSNDPQDLSRHAHRDAVLVIDERDNFIRGMAVTGAWERGAVLVAGVARPFKGVVDVNLASGADPRTALADLRMRIAILSPGADGRMRAFLHSEDGWHCPEIEALEGDVPDLEAAARELQDMLDARVEATLEPEM